MKYTTIDLLRRISENKILEDEENIIDKVNQLLEEDSTVVESYFRVHFSKIVEDLLHSYSKDYDLYFEVDSFCYLDDDNKKKIAIFIAFLQDYRKIITDLDYQVLKAVIDKVEESKLHLFINDLNVNSIQWRDGQIIGEQRI